MVNINSSDKNKFIKKRFSTRHDRIMTLANSIQVSVEFY